MPAVRFDGVFADTELGCDLLVEFAARNARHDLKLAGGEAIAPLANERQLSALRACLPIALDGLVNRRQQVVTPEGLWQELESAGFHRTHGHLDIAVACNEDHRNIATAR